jgi:hypothetical protein
MGRGDHQAAAAQIAAGLEDFPQSQPLSGLAREARRAVQNRADNARRRAEAAGRHTTESFKRGAERLASASATPTRSEGLRRSVALYLEAASLFAEALTEPVPASVTARDASPTLSSIQPQPAAALPTMASGVTAGIRGVTLPLEPPPAASSPATSPAPSSSSAPTPPATLAADEATAMLRRFADLLVTFDPSKLSSVYPRITERDRNFLRTAKDTYESCSLRFSTPRVVATADSGTVFVHAESVLACKPRRRGTNPPDQLMSNAFELRRTTAGWLVHTWNSNLGIGN